MGTAHVLSIHCVSFSNGRPVLPMLCVHVPLLSVLLLVLACSPSSGNEKCHPFPRGWIAHDVTGSDVMIGDVINYDFHLDLNLSSTASRVVINIIATSLKFYHKDSRDSVTWALQAWNGTVFNRNSSTPPHAEKMFARAHELSFETLGSDNYTLQGSFSMQVSDKTGAGELVQSALEVTVVRADNLTCYTSVQSSYFYIPPPQMWVSSDTKQPVPMMGKMDTVVNLRLVQSTSFLSSSVVQVRTPSEESSREVILTLQGASVDHVTGFTSASTADVDMSEAFQRSTYSSFQNDIGEIAFPPLERDMTNYSSAGLAMKFTSRTEDYSELRDGDIVYVNSAVAFSKGEWGEEEGEGGRGAESGEAATGGTGCGGDISCEGVSAAGGANLIWVSSIPVTLKVPPLDQKQPDLDLSIRQKTSCAYDGETQSQVDVKIVHSANSTATAYNVTARVYLTDAMTVYHHVNSELRQNSLSVVQNDSVVYVDIERMTFSDPTTITLDLDVDLSDPKLYLAEHHVIMADAIFTDRWGNSSGMFTDIDYVFLQLDRPCSQRINWTSSLSSCTCPHDASRSDCACCLPGACPCGHVNPSTCQPCDRPFLCQPYLPGFEAITELEVGDGETTYVCAAYQLYRPWSKGISCYRRKGKKDNYTWDAVNPIVGVILARDKQTDQLYGVSNNGLAHVRSDDHGVTWFTVHADYYQSKLASANMETAVLIYDGLEMQ